MDGIHKKIKKKALNEDRKVREVEKITVFGYEVENARISVKAVVI